MVICTAEVWLYVQLKYVYKNYVQLKSKYRLAIENLLCKMFGRIVRFLTVQIKYV